jgi:hypothetical protein
MKAARASIELAVYMIPTRPLPVNLARKLEFTYVGIAELKLKKKPMTYITGRFFEKLFSSGMPILYREKYRNDYWSFCGLLEEMS